PGGWLLLEEPDFFPVYTSTSQIYIDFMVRLTGTIVAASGRDCLWARVLPALVAAQELEEVGGAGWLVLLKAGQLLSGSVGCGRASGGALAGDRGADAVQGAGLWGAQGRALRGGHGVAPRPHVLGVCRCEHRGVGATPAGWRGSTSWVSIGLIPLRRLTGRGWAEHRPRADPH